MCNEGVEEDDRNCREMEQGKREKWREWEEIRRRRKWEGGDGEDGCSKGSAAVGKSWRPPRNYNTGKSQRDEKRGREFGFRNQNKFRKMLQCFRITTTKHCFDHERRRQQQYYYSLFFFKQKQNNQWGRKIILSCKFDDYWLMRNKIFIKHL